MEPEDTGWNVTVMVQLELPGSDVPQVLVWLKAPASGPLNRMLLTLIAAAPAFVMVTGSELI